MRLLLVFSVSLPVLAQFNDLETRGGIEDSMCLQEWPKLIIRAAESIKEGATFLKTVESSSREDCDSRCCGTKNCNVGVYGKFGQCFLFDCLNNDAEDFVCTFEQHASFNTLVKTPVILNAYARWGLKHSAEQIVNASTKDVHNKNIVADVNDEGGCSRLAWQCDNKGTNQSSSLQKLLKISKASKTHKKFPKKTKIACVQKPIKTHKTLH